MPAKILSVDDSKIIRMIVQKAFADLDCIILQACNGEEGLAAIQNDKPDLVLLDITMPVMDGVTMLTQMKEHPDMKDIPVIMLTAEAAQENVDYIMGLGVNDYLKKPFQEETLREKVSLLVPLSAKAV